MTTPRRNSYRDLEGFDVLPKIGERRFIVYLVQNKVNGKGYVGVSGSVRLRLRVHVRDKYPIGNALRKHGLGMFRIAVLFEGDEPRCYELEPTLITSLGTLNVLGGYNIHPGGSKPPTLRGENHPGFGVRLSETTKQRIRERRALQEFSLETRAKMGMAHRGENNTNAKLTTDLVREIRASEGSYNTLSAKYSVSRSVIAEVKTRRTWKHVM